MSIKADWGQSTLEGCADEDGSSPKSAAPLFDPFDAAVSAASMLNSIENSMPVASVSLDTPVDELQRMLSVSIKREGRFDAVGITCALKDMPGSSCVACPLNRSRNDDDPKQALCRIGMEQEILSTYLLAQGHGERVGVAG